ncbi:hypothetical protein [Streptomyces sp. NPDC058157]|uniref:hypothetical protein n=1 Tax=Streptomyces sp. NPDC058157 TaxID=3346360 RepID=UPI0036E13ED0
MGRVRWADLTHAYGSAEDVPGRLSRVGWGDTRTAVLALGDLGLWLGELAVFDATAAAVPFLWDLAVAEAVTVRPGVIELLASILHHANPPHLEVQFAAHRAVLDGERTAQALTRDGDPAVRTAALGLLAAIDGHACATCRAAADSGRAP